MAPSLKQQQRRRRPAKIFILITLGGLLGALLLHCGPPRLVRLAAAGSKSKEKASKTTVIAISGGQPAGKPHPVPVPWPVVHCHHHHHHLKYVPKPVLVHHWVKKFKPIEMEAAGEHFQAAPVAESQQHQHHAALMQANAFMPGSPLPAQRAFHTTNNYLAQPPPPPPAAANQQLAALFSQTDQSKLPYDLMDGSQLVSALSGAFEPAASGAGSPQQQQQQIITAPQVTMVLPPSALYDHEHERGRPHAHEGPSYQLADDNYKLATAANQSELRAHEIDRELDKFHQSGRTAAKKSPRPAGSQQQRAQFSSKQLDRLAKTIKSAQKQQLRAAFDSEPVDSLKSNVVAADQAQADSTRPVARNHRELDYSSVSSGGAAESLEGDASRRPSHPFNEPQDQLRDESGQFGGHTAGAAAANRFGVALQLANQREELEAQRALAGVARDQASRLAALNGAHSLQPLGAHSLVRPLVQPIVANLNALGARARAHPQAAAAAVSARMASALSESHTINLMTRLAERLAQLEAKSLLDRQLARQAPPRAAAAKSASAHNQTALTARAGLMANVDQLLHLLSGPFKSSRDKRRQSGVGRKLASAAASGNRQQQQQALDDPMSVEASARKFVWTTQSDLKQPEQLQQQQQQQLAKAAPMEHLIITASPLSLDKLRGVGANHTFALAGGRANAAASSRFMSQRTTAPSAQAKKKPAALEKLTGEASSLVNVVEPAASRQQQQQRQQEGATVAAAAPNGARVAGEKKTATTTTTRAPSLASEPPAVGKTPGQQLMTAEQADRFYVGQHEHLEKAQRPRQQPEGPAAGQASQVAPESQPPPPPQQQQQQQQQQQPQPQEAPPAAQLRAKQLQLARRPAAQLDGGRPSAMGAKSALVHTARLYSSQSSNVRQSVVAPQFVQLSGAPDGSQQQPGGHEEQAGAQAPLSADQLASYLEFPMSPQQWSSEAMRTINAEASQQRQRQKPADQGNQEDGEQAQPAAEEGDEQQADKTRGESAEEAEAQANEQQQQQQQQDEQQVQYELMPGNQLAGGFMPTNNFHAQMAPSFSFFGQQHTAFFPQQQQQQQQQMAQAASPYGYYTAGHQQEAGPSGAFAELLPAGLSQLLESGGSQFSANYNPMTQQPYFRPHVELNGGGGGGDGWTAPAVQFGGGGAGEMAAPTQVVGVQSAGMLPAASLISQSLAGPSNDIAQLRQFQSSLNRAVASQANNLTGLTALTGSLRNQMQARFPPQMPQIPNIPQPPQLPNLPMPPPGMMQMAASVALPLAMARISRQNNRFRNNQVNAAASAGGSTAGGGGGSGGGGATGAATTPGQRLVQSATNLTNRLMRSSRQRRRRRQPTSAPTAGHRRQPFVFGRPNGSGSPPLSSHHQHGLNIGAGSLSSANRRRRPPVVRFLQTVVDMSRRPLAASATSNVLGAAAKAAASAAVSTAASAVASQAAASAASAVVATTAPSAIASAATSAVAQAAAAVAADKLKPKVDIERHSTRLARSLERLQLDLRRVSRQQQATSGATLKTPLSLNDEGERAGESAVVLPGLPPVVMSDGSLATFGSMTSPVDLLNRQLAQRRARELARPTMGAAAAAAMSAYNDGGATDDDNSAGAAMAAALGSLMQPNFELLRLSTLAANAQRPGGAGQARQRHQAAASGVSPAPNYELITANALAGAQALGPDQQRRATRAGARGANATQQPAGAPIVANHFNLLMFTAQNVTGHVSAAKAAAGPEAPAAATTTTTTPAEQALMETGEQQATSGAAQDDPNGAASFEPARGGESEQSQGEEAPAEVSRISAAGSEQEANSIEMSAPVLAPAQMAPKGTPSDDGDDDISGEQSGETMPAPTSTTSAPSTTTSTAPTIQSWQKGRKFSPFGSNSQAGGQAQPTTSAPAFLLLAGTTAAPQTSAGTLKQTGGGQQQWQASGGDSHAVAAAAANRHWAVESPVAGPFREQTMAPASYGAIRGTRLEALKHKRVGTSARPTRAAMLDAELLEQLRKAPEAGRRPARTTTTEQPPTVKPTERVEPDFTTTTTAATTTTTMTTTTRSVRSASDEEASRTTARPAEVERDDYELAGASESRWSEPGDSQRRRQQQPAGSTQAPIGDYVRAIKLVRALAYPWPPPTQRALAAA